MYKVFFVAWCCLAMAGCAVGDGPEPDRVQSYVPVEVPCPAACPAGSDGSQITVCRDKTRALDWTSGCHAPALACFCSKHREGPPRVL